MVWKCPAKIHEMGFDVIEAAGLSRVTPGDNPAPLREFSSKREPAGAALNNPSVGV